MRVFIYHNEKAGNYIGRAECHPPYKYGCGKSITVCLADLMYSYPSLENTWLDPIEGTYDEYLTQQYIYVINTLLDKCLPLQEPHRMAAEFNKYYQTSHLTQYWPCNLKDPKTLELIKACLKERYYPFADEFTSCLSTLQYKDN